MNILLVVESKQAVRFLACLLFAFSMVACGTLSAPPTSSSIRPQWVIAPVRPDYISVVGFAPKQANGGVESQQRIALMKARQQLGQIVRVRIENTIQISKEDRGGKASSKMASDTRLSSTAALNLGNAQESALWIDPENGNLYLLLELPQK